MLSDKTIQEIVNKLKSIDNIDFTKLNQKIVKELQDEYRDILTLLRKQKS